MELRDSWQALQGRLSAARALAETGNRTGALEEIDRALAIDPEFLAAQSLKQRLAAIVDIPLTSDAPASALGAFEARARARRATRRLAAAHDAIARGDFDSAAEALDEARELDADASALVQAERELAEARLQRRRRRAVGPLAAAAATLVAGVLGATYLGERSGQQLDHGRAAGPGPTTAAATATSGSAFGDVLRVEPQTEIVTLRPKDEAPAEAPIPEAMPPRVLSASIQSPTDAADEPAERVSNSRGTAGDVVPASTAVAPPPPVTAALNNPMSPAMNNVMPPSMATVAPIGEPELPPAHVEASPAPAAKPNAAVSPVAPVTKPPVVPARAADAQVRDVLQRYRAAYDELNARSAHAVWPAVDERALAQAFSGLAEQRLVFDACDVDMHGDAATAVCRGSARYVPKVGSGDPQVEPRTWKFTLRRAGDNWAIDTARAESGVRAER